MQQCHAYAAGKRGRDVLSVVTPCATALNPCGLAGLQCLEQAVGSAATVKRPMAELPSAPLSPPVAISVVAVAILLGPGASESATAAAAGTPAHVPATVLLTRSSSPATRMCDASRGAENFAKLRVAGMMRVDRRREQTTCVSLCGFAPSRNLDVRS